MVGQIDCIQCLRKDSFLLEMATSKQNDSIPKHLTSAKLSQLTHFAWILMMEKIFYIL